MGYVTLNLSATQLTEGGGLWVDQGTEQCADRYDRMPVTLHHDDLVRGTFVIAMKVHGRLVPYTWKCDLGDYRAAVHMNGVQEGGTLEQFLHRCGEHAESAQIHGRDPRVALHIPRS